MSGDGALGSGDPVGNVVVTYRSSVGRARWQERHQQSPVPGAWPYGLDELEHHLPIVSAVDVPALSGLRARAAALLGVRRRRHGHAAAVALAWDEMSAVDMLAAQRADRYFAGVIWATDTVTAGGDSRTLRTTASALRQMDGLWVLSRPQARAVRSWLGSRCPPVYFLRFGVDAAFYSPAPEAPAHPHLVSVGGDRDRDPETLLAALQLVRATHPEVRVTVQSRSPQPVPEGVVKVDRLPHVEVARLLADATVAVLATRPNLHASGMTVGLEAQASSVPVVACDTPGMRDYFDDGVTARLVPPRQPAAMAAAIVDLLDQPSRARAMGQAGRQSVLTSHTTSSMAEDLARIIRGQAQEA